MSLKHEINRLKRIADDLEEYIKYLKSNPISDAYVKTFKDVTRENCQIIEFPKDDK